MQNNSSANKSGKITIIDTDLTARFDHLSGL